MPKKIPSTKNIVEDSGQRTAKRVPKVPSETSIKLGERIAAARESMGMSRQQAAEVLGVGYTALYEIETGKKGASLDRLWEIAQAWGVDPASLDSRLASSAINMPDLNYGRLIRALAVGTTQLQTQIVKDWVDGRRLPGDEDKVRNVGIGQESKG